MPGYLRVIAGLAVLSVAAASPNVAMEAILCPFGVVDSGQTVTPRVVVRNAGDVLADSFWTHFTIDNEMDMVIYHDSTVVHGLEPGTSDTIGFTPWVPVGRDSMGALAWTWWDEDSVPEDDSLVQRFLVRVKDIAITQVYNPIPGDTIDPGEVYPKVRLFNHGNVTIRFPMIFNIGPYFDTTWVVIIPGGSRTVSAGSPWTATAGIWLCNMNAQVAGDLHPENNDTTFVFYVRGTVGNSVRIAAILCPTGVMDTLPFVPQALYGNYGCGDITCTTYCYIDREWSDPDEHVYYAWTPVMLMAGMNSTVAFTPCTLKVEGPYVVACSVHLGPETDTDYVVARQTFHVHAGPQHEVIIDSLLLPDTVDLGAVLSPVCVLHNDGFWRETFKVWVRADGGYLESLAVSDLGVKMSKTLRFPPWHARASGWSRFTAWVSLQRYSKYHDSVYVRATGVEDEGGEEKARAVLEVAGLMGSTALVRFTLPEAGNVDIAVYSTAGSQVRLLSTGRSAPGCHQVMWDGRDDSGRALGAGIYCLRLRKGDSEVYRKVVKLE